MTQEYKLTMLTPVHIGSGETLLENLDYSIREQNFYYHPHQDLLKTNEHSEEIYLDINGANIRSKFERKFGAIRPLNVQIRRGTQIKQHIRSNCELYIPGSSIKGALKSLYFNYFSKQEYGISAIKELETYFSKHLGDRNHPQFAESLFTGQRLNGKSNKDLPEISNLDPFRFVRISDFHSKSTEQNSTILNIKVLTGFGNEDPGIHFNQYSIYLESLKKGCQFYGKFSITNNNDSNKNLLSRLNISKGAEIDQIHAEGLKNENIISFSRSINLEWIDLELESIEKYYTTNPNEEDNINIMNDSLIDIAEKIEKNKHAIFLRLGMGAGFSMMTGNWHGSPFKNQNNEWASEFLRTARSRNDTFPFFPRSRKIADYTSYLGFVMLEPVST